MIHFMLNNLRRPAGVGLYARLQFDSLIPHLYRSVPLTFARTAEEGQAAILGIVRAVLFDNLGIKHYRVCRSSSALVKKCDDAFFYANHVCCHTDTAFFMGNQCIH